MLKPERHEVVLTILNEAAGIDLHVGPRLGPTAQRVLQALALGGPLPVDGEFTEADRVPEPAATQDDDELIVNLVNVFHEKGLGDTTADGMALVLAHLRSHGLLRTPADARVIEHMKAAELRACEAEHQAVVAQAQVRALTAKCGEANAAREALQEKYNAVCFELHEMGEKLASEGRRAIAASEREAQVKAQLEAARADYEARLVEWRKVAREGEEAQAALAMVNESLKAAKVRIEALERQQTERLQAHEAHRE